MSDVDEDALPEASEKPASDPRRHDIRPKPGRKPLRPPGEDEPIPEPSPEGDDSDISEEDGGGGSGHSGCDW